MTTTVIHKESDSLQRINAQKGQLKQVWQEQQKEKMVQKAAIIYEDVDYSQEWRLAYSLSVLLSWMANSYSFATQSFAIGWLVFLWVSSFVSLTVAAIVAIVSACILALSLELLKRLVAKVTFKRWFKKRAMLLPSLALLSFISLSVLLSFYASLHLPSKLASLPKMEDISSINSSFNLQIEEFQKERDTYRINRLYKNRLASKDAKVIKQYNDDIKLLRSQYSKTVEEAKASNQLALYSWEKENVGLGYILGYIALGLELLFLLSLAYQYRYIWDCYLENAPTPSDPQPTNSKTRKKEVLSNTEELAPKAAQREGGNVNENSSNHCLTILDSEKETGSDSKDKLVINNKIIQIADNETIEEIRKIKDRLSKNWERAFTSKGLETRQRNLKQAQFWAKHLEVQYRIRVEFDSENRKVHFQTIKTA